MPTLSRPPSDRRGGSPGKASTPSAGGVDLLSGFELAGASNSAVNRGGGAVGAEGGASAGAAPAPVDIFADFAAHAPGVEVGRGQDGQGAYGEESFKR